MKTVSIHILGCRVNQSEGESFLEYFRNAGYQLVPFGSAADVTLIHTCTVTGQADGKSRQMIRKGRKASPGGVLVVTGCYAQMQPEVLREMPEADLIIGMKDRHRILELVEDYRSHGVHVFPLREEYRFEELLQASPDTTRAFLKIQEGCDSYCTYCIIPMARGPIRSREEKEILREIQSLEEKGYKEVVLTGIHTGAYGKERGGSLAELLDHILVETGMPRIRLGSLDPNEITEEFCKVFADPRFMPHVHLSLQCGDDGVLRRMKRRYSARDYRETVRKLKEIKGESLSVTADVMVGFPGETEGEHASSMDFIRNAGIDNLHVFRYSRRKGTKAAEYPGQLSKEVKNLRGSEMAALGDALHRSFLEAQRGRETTVLLEERSPEGEVSGYAENFLRVRIPRGEGCLLNTLIPVRITGWAGDDLIGEVKKDE